MKMMKEHFERRWDASCGRRGAMRQEPEGKADGKRFLNRFEVF
jgi:hypothetical protein